MFAMIRKFTMIRKLQYLERRKDNLSVPYDRRNLSRKQVNHRLESSIERFSETIRVRNKDMNK